MVWKLYNWQEAVDIYNLFANRLSFNRGRAIIRIKRTRAPWQRPYKGTGVDKAWECCQHTFLALYIAADESNKNASSHPKHGRVNVTYKWEGNFNQWILILLPLSSFRESIHVCLDNPSRWSACENVGFYRSVFVSSSARQTRRFSKQCVGVLFLRGRKKKNPQTATLDGLFYPSA